MRRWARAVVFGAVLGLGAAAFALTPAGQRFEETAGLTTLFRLRGPVPPPPQVAIVSLDEAAAVQLGLPLLPRDWPRSLHGRLIDALVAKGAAVIAFDLLFERPQPLEEDLAFARAIATSRRVILFEAIERRQPQPQGDEPSSAVWLELLRRPLPVFANAAAGLAPFPLPKVPGRVHQFWAFLPQSGDRPTLPAVVLQAYAARVDPAWGALFAILAETFVGNTPLASAAPAVLGDDATTALSFRQVFEAGGDLARRLRAELASAAEPAAGGAGVPPPAKLREALMALYQGPSRHYLNPYGPPGTIRHISYDAVLAGAEAGGAGGESLSGVAVFVGFSELTKPSKLDGFDTVFHRADGIDTSGVEIAATAFANLLTGSTIRPLSPTGIVLGLLGAGLGLGLMVFTLPMPRAVVMAVPLAAGFTLLVLELFSRQQIWLPLAVPLLLQLPLALLAGALAQYLLAMRRQRDLQRAKDDADAASLAKSGFVAFVIHDLRNRMSGVIGFMELLGGTPLDRTQQSLVAEARNSSNSALKIVNDVLDQSKIEAGELQLHPEAFDPLDLARRAVESVRPFAQAKQLPLWLEPQLPLPPAVVSDPLRVQQILTNLLDNAIKFTERGAVTVRVRADDWDGDRVLLVFEVSDTGIGIDPAVLATIFQPFKQASAATPHKFGGTGLGLSIVQRLSTLLGGDIAVRSAEGEGSVFTLRLPVVLAPPALAALPPSAGARSSKLCDHEPPSPLGGSPPAARGDGEVLVVEDHPTSRRLIAAQLETLGFSARLTGDGEEAWSSLCERPVATIITDYHMPHLDGVGLARRIRGDRRLAHVWIIGLTADVRDGSMRDCIDAGMDVVLVKPTSLAAIERALAAAARPGGNGAAEAPVPAAAGPQALAGDWPVFDPANLCEAFGGLDRQALELLQSFVDDTGACLRAIRCHVSDRQARPLAQAAHRLAGTSLSMGAPRLGHLCRDLERAALTLLEQPHGDWAQADRLMVAIEAGFGALSAAVAEVCDDQRSTS